MEVIALDTSMISVKGKFVEIKVRSNEEDYKYYLFPTEVIEGTLNLLKENEIHVDDIPATSRILANLPLAESKYSVEELPESMCTALHSEVDINEIYELIDYVSAHEDEIITVTLYKNSELPEFQNILSDKAKNELLVEVQTAIEEYMKMLLDMKHSDRQKMILDYMEKADFRKMLKYYSDNVVSYIKKNVTKRLEDELEEKPRKLTTEEIRFYVDNGLPIPGGPLDWE